MMTKKNFQAIAQILRIRKLACTAAYDFMPGAKFVVRALAAELAVYFKEDNPAFDAARFMKACGCDDE